MKYSDSLAHGALRGLGFSAVALATVTIYVAVAEYASLPQVNSGNTISSSAWNGIVDYANKAVKQDSQTISVVGNKVGIGTSSPNEALSVNGIIQGKWNSDVSRSHSLMLMRVNGNDVFDGTAMTMDVGMGLGLTNMVGGGKINSDGTGWNYLGTRGASKLHLGDGFLSLETSTSSAGTTGAAIAWNSGLYMTVAGNVGIGTLSPTEKLDVSGGNVKMGYEIVTASIPSTSAIGWYYATCPAGKYVIGGACSTGAGNVSTNTDVSGTTYGCYKSATTTNWQIKAICANIR